MTNLERWNLYMKDIVSPQAYIDWGFYYMIAAALRRQVWLGHLNSPIFANIYVMLVGDAAVGKGRVIQQVAPLLRTHPYVPRINREQITEPENRKFEISPEDLEEMAKAYGQLNENQQERLKHKEPVPLIPVGADATSWEALVRELARSTRPAPYRKFDPKTEKEVIVRYAHCSLCFCLEEASSLFRRDAEKVVRFLLNTYDCGDYRYDTITRDKDVIKNCCVSLLAGATPDFMQEVFTDKLLSEGFASRCMFIYEYSNRFNRLLIDEYSNEQLEAKEHIKHHIKNIANLTGEARLTPDALAFMKDWWENHTDECRVNRSTKLIPYYGRKNLHALKLAMCIHFADKLDMTITLDECKKALEFLDEAERKMHFAVTLDNKNPLASTARNVARFVASNGPQSFDELLVEFYGECPMEDLKEVLSFLQKTGQIKVSSSDGKKIKYELVRKKRK